MHQEEESSHHGVMAQFDNPDDLLAAARATFAAGYRKMDAYSPLPIHGLADAIGYKRTRLPWLVFVWGLLEQSLDTLSVIGRQSLIIQ